MASLTIVERESIQKTDGDDTGDFALGMMIEKALDADGKRLFQDGEKAQLNAEAVAQEIN